jgi:hypothetical protein
VIIDNLIFINGGEYDDIKKILRQWIVLYSDDLQSDLTFELYKSGRENHIIKVDERLDNEWFYYLVNYLYYPEGIEANIGIEGFTIGKDNNVLKNQKLLVYISPNDKDGDNVFIATSEGKNFKFDFGGKIIEAYENKLYQLPVYQHLKSPEIIRLNEKEISQEKENKSKKSIEKRFKIISILIFVCFLINILIPNFQNGMEIFEDTTTWLFFGVGLWFFADYEMLKSDSFFIKSLLIVIGGLCYVFSIRNYFQQNHFKLILASSLSPLTLLIVQWPARRIFRAIFKCEPKVERNGNFSDFTYTLILFLALVVLPFLIVDAIK